MEKAMPETMNLTYTTKLTSLTCGNCEIPFAMPDDMLRAAMRDGRFFWCPNGHKIHYATSENDELRKKLADEERWQKSLQAQLTHEQDQRRAAERSASAYKGQTTRLKNRAAAGVCPCCNRSFVQLRRHMETKHPDFAESDSGSDPRGCRPGRCGAHAPPLRERVQRRAPDLARLRR
jgi:hypothetical protein